MKRIPGFVIKEGYTLQEGWNAVGPGWKDLVTEAFQMVDAYGGAKVVQVKEKFGALTIYLDNHREIETELHQLRTRSTRICEECGAEGKTMRAGGLVYTACPLHTLPESVDVSSY